ncbi:MAG: cobalamin B12-binding domain-containing protein [Alphaproteobacteria bacterium]|jgi:methylmalonyl-CoA mutase C-terminal domain/subunit|nr:cobalamin B12-binding domain-containing protein [Alphaproteobacteria bacterium]MDP6812755.1 cobalamin B12-binding domain-containing protein [Alphaproteobacteria bacterium]
MAAVRTTPIRVLVAKPGLDGHDRGAKVLAHAMRDAGMEVIYTGLRQTPATIVDIAVEEDVDVVCVSVLSGAHNMLFAEIMEGLRARAAGDIPVLGGGVIPDQDIALLKQMGVREVFTPGASLTAITGYIRDLVSA